MCLSLVTRRNLNKGVKVVTAKIGVMPVIGVMAAIGVMAILEVMLIVAVTGFMSVKGGTAVERFGHFYVLEAVD